MITEILNQYSNNLKCKFIFRNTMFRFKTICHVRYYNILTQVYDFRYTTGLLI